MLRPTLTAANSSSVAAGDDQQRSPRPARRTLIRIVLLVACALLVGQAPPLGGVLRGDGGSADDPTPAAKRAGRLSARIPVAAPVVGGIQPPVEPVAEVTVADPIAALPTASPTLEPTATGEPAASGSQKPDPTLRPPPTASPVLVTPKPVFSLRVPVLTYHVIAPWEIAQPYASTDSDVVPELFDAQLKALRDAGWRTVTADALADALQREHPLPRRTMVIAIDDGHDDGFDFGLPILLRHQFTATYYVISGRVGTPTYLTWDQVRALRDAGMEIGNHTLTHVHLTTLAPSDVLRQIAGAQTAFAEQLGRSPTTFAYPFGEFDSVTISAVRTADLRLAFTTKRGQTATWASRYTLPRVHVGGGMTPAQLLKAVNQFLVAAP